MFSFILCERLFSFFVFWNDNGCQAGGSFVRKHCTSLEERWRHDKDFLASSQNGFKLFGTFSVLYVGLNYLAFSILCVQHWFYRGVFFFFKGPLYPIQHHLMAKVGDARNVNDKTWFLMSRSNVFCKYRLEDSQLHPITGEQFDRLPYQWTRSFRTSGVETQHLFLFICPIALCFYLPTAIWSLWSLHSESLNIMLLYAITTRHAQHWTHIISNIYSSRAF